MTTQMMLSDGWSPSARPKCRSHRRSCCRRAGAADGVIVALGLGLLAGALISQPPWPAPTAGIWGVNFVVAAGYGGTGTTYISTAMPPETLSAEGNLAAVASASFVSDTMPVAVAANSVTRR